MMIDKGAYCTYSSMKFACGSGNINLVNILIENNSSINCIEVWNGGLHGACKNGYVDIVELMLAKGAQCKFGFDIACKYGHVDVIKLLIDRDVYNWHSSSSSSFYYSCLSDNIQVAKMIWCWALIIIMERRKGLN